MGFRYESGDYRRDRNGRLRDEKGRYVKEWTEDEITEIQEWYQKHWEENELAPVNKSTYILRKKRGLSLLELLQLYWEAMKLMTFWHWVMVALGAYLIWRLFE